MAADGDGGGGGAEWQPIYDRVQAQADAIAADRARLMAASKVQRESWEAARRLQRTVEELQAAAQEKDAEMDRLREEAADARKKLLEVRQADARRKVRWEAAYVDLILGANQKLDELRDGDMEDSRICAETPNSMEVGSCIRLAQNTLDQACVASDLGTELRKLKQAYETMSSKKDQEVSALLSEKELVRNQLVMMQQDYTVLLRNKKWEAAQASKAAQKLQQSVDDLKILAQNKDDEIDRLRAEAIAAQKKLDTAQKLQQSIYDLKVSAQKKDDEIVRLRTEAVAAEKKLQTAQKLQQSVDDLKVSAQKKDDEIVKLRTEAVAAEKKLQTAQKLQQSVDDLKVSAQTKDDEIVRLRTEAVAAEKKLQTAQKLQQSVDDLKVLAQTKDDEIVKLRTEAVAAEKKLHTAQKLQQSVDDLKESAQKKDDEIGRLGAEVFAAEKKLQKMHSLVKEKDDEIRRLKGPHPESIEKWNTYIAETHKKSRSDDPAITVSSKPKNDGLRQMGEEDYISERETVEKDGQDETSQKRRRVSSTSNDDEQSVRDEDVHSGTGSDEDGDDQSGSDEGGDEQSGSDEDGDDQSGSDGDGDDQSGSDEDGDDQSGSDEDGDDQSGSDENGEQRRSDDIGDEQSRSDHDDDGQSRSNNQVRKPLLKPKRKRDACNAQVANGKSHNESNVSVKNWHYWYHRAPPPLLSQKLQISNGRHCLVPTGHWNNYVTLVNDSLADQPDKHKKFVQFLRNFENWRIRDVARTMQVVLDGHPKLIRRFNRFLPQNCQIKIEEREDEEKQNPDDLPDGELRGSDVDDDEQNGGDVDGDEGSGNDEDGDEQSKTDDVEQRRSDEHNKDENGQSGHDVEVEATNNPVQMPFGNLKRKRHACNAQVANSKSHIESNGIGAVAGTMKVMLDGQPKLILRFNQFLLNSHHIEAEEDEEEESTPSSSCENMIAVAGLMKLKEAQFISPRV